MSWLILMAVLSGLLCGRFLFTAAQVAGLSQITPWALALLLFSIGFDLAVDRTVWQRFRGLGWRVLAVPLAGAIGSLLGVLVGGGLLRMHPWEALSVGAGFGWYSLSGVLLSNLGFPALGAVAFLCNVLRELLAVVSMPWLAQRLGPYVAIAPGGATTMDTTLPILARYGTHESTLAAFINGALLSLAVPLLVPFFAGLIN